MEVSKRKDFDIKAFIFAISIIIVLIVASVYALRFLELKKIQNIESELEVTTAIITEKHSYKGKGFTVQYQIGDKQYRFRSGVSSELYDSYEVGSQIILKYKRSEPDKAMFDDK